MTDMIHHYDRVDGRYLGSSPAAIDPLDPGMILLPAWATRTAPPEIPDGMKAHWTGDEWELVPDAPPPPESELLAQAKQAAIATVDGTAEYQRLQHITPGAAQAMVYLAKEAEARRFLLDAAPDGANYALLSAEVGLTAPDLAGVAASVIAQADHWLSVAADIERIRLGAKRDIAAADSIATVEAIVQALVWP